MADLKSLCFLDDKRPEMTARLKDWCAINSGSRNLDGLAAMRAVLAEAFAELGAEVETVPAGPMPAVGADGVAREEKVGDLLRIVKRPQARVRALLTGHMDTVFPVDHPFQAGAMLDDDTLNAPGAADMKGGLLVLLYALKCLEHSPYAEDVGFEVLINADEEIGSLGSAEALVAGARRAHFACIYEPALPDGTLAGARKGSGNFTAVAHGKAAHAGREHHLGRNALVAIARFVDRLDALNGQREGVTINAAKIEGGGPNNVVPDMALARFNIRVPDFDAQAWAEEEVKRVAAEVNAFDGVSLDLHGGFYRPPKPMTPETEAFFNAVKATGAELGLDIAWKATGGCCDGNNIQTAGIPVVDTLGVRGANIHSAQEIAKLDSLVERARLSALLFMKIAAGEIPLPRGREDA